MTGTVTGGMGSSAVRGRTAACDVPEFFDNFGALYRCAPGMGWTGSKVWSIPASSPGSMPRAANGEESTVSLHRSTSTTLRGTDAEAVSRFYEVLAGRHQRRRKGTPIVSSKQNRQVWLRSRPTGIPRASDFGLREVAVPTISDDAFLVQNQYLSADPAMRGWINDSYNYDSRIEIGDTMRAFAAGVIIESRNDAYAVGDQVMGFLGGRNTPRRLRHRYGARLVSETCRSRYRWVCWD